MGEVISIDYWDMYNASRAAKKTADCCENYADEIKRKVTNKLGDLKLGSNNNTSQANYFAQRKIKDLQAKKTEMEKLSKQIDSAKEYAKEKDSAVSSYIKKESKDFRKEHDMKVGVLEEFFVWLDTTIINSTAFGRFLKEKMSDISNWIDEKKRKFKQWWELEGGKYIVGAVIAVIAVVVATIFLFAVAIPALVTAIAGFTAAASVGAAIWTLVTAAAGFVTAIVAVADGLTKAVYGIQAALVFEDDPGWAKRYSEYSSFADYLRKQNFHNGFLNKLSYIVANGIDVVSTIASVINIADFVKRGASFISQIKSKGADKIFWKVKFKGKSGKVTWGTFKYGLKRLFDNVKVIKTYMGNTNLSRLQNFHEKSMPGYKIYKSVKDINKGISSFKDWADKGTIKFSLDTIKDKIKENTISYDYIDKIVESIKNVKKTGDTINKTPAYAQ